MTPGNDRKKMNKYDAEAYDKAYQLIMVEARPMDEVLMVMREDYPKLSRATLYRWKRRKRTDWEERYKNYCTALEAKTDKELLKQYTPMLKTIQEVREKVYDRLIGALGNTDIINDKNIGKVLYSFAKLGELEYKMTGGGRGESPPVKQVIGVIFMVLERDPVVGPALKTNRDSIVDAIFEEIKSET
jgi:mevalonate kinase